MISKSDYVRFIKCPRLYYLNKHNKDEAGEKSLMVENIIEAGNEIGAYARSYFGDDYYLVNREHATLQDTVDETLAAIKNGHKVICEASFLYKDLYCAVDILRVNKDGSFDIYEVKSNKPNERYKFPGIFNDDVSFQNYVLTNAGYKVNGNYLLLINRDYEFCNDLCPQNYFSTYGSKLKNNVSKNLDQMRAILSEPDFTPSASCKRCAFHGHCYDSLPKPSIFEIRGGFSQAKQYLAGIKTFQDVFNNKSSYDLSGPNARNALQQVEFELFNKPQYVDKVKLKKWLDSLVYPIYHFDFEGIKDYFPFIEGENIEFERPIQYSLDIQRYKGGPLEHIDYLRDAAGDNTEEIIKRMIKDLGTSGSILVFNKTYEEGRLKALQKLHPQYFNELQALIDRIVDLMVPFIKRYVYRKELKGSYSIKEILPAYCPDHADDYHELPLVHKGDQITEYFNELINSQGAKHKEIYDGMIEYCSQDTLSEVYVLEELYKLV